MTATINVKTDLELKKQAEELFSDLGMNMTTALNVFLRQSVRENRIPFEIAQSSDPFYLKSNIDYVKKSVDELRAGRGTEHELIED